MDALVLCMYSNIFLLFLRKMLVSIHVLLSIQKSTGCEQSQTYCTCNGKTTEASY